jgi:hypothetical protein
MALELDGRRKELCDWLTANRINPDTVPLHGDLTIHTVDGQRVIHYEAFVRGENGRVMADERGENEAVERRTVPLLVEPPDWFEPYEKPTRAQLLAVVEQVRALHDDLCGITGARWIADQLDTILGALPRVRSLDEEQP